MIAVQIGPLNSYLTFLFSCRYPLQNFFRIFSFCVFFLRFDVQVYNSVPFSVCFHPFVFPLTNYVPRRNEYITLVAPTLRTGYSGLFHSSIRMYTTCRDCIQFKSNLLISARKTWIFVEEKDKWRKQIIILLESVSCIRNVFRLSVQLTQNEVISMNHICMFEVN